MLLIVALGVMLLYGTPWAVLESSATGQDARELRDTLRVGATTEIGLSLAATLATILVVIIASSTIGAEYGWGTIRTLLPRASGRLALATAKLVTIGLFVTVLVVFDDLVSLGMSALVTSAAGSDVDLGDGFAGHSLASVGLAVYLLEDLVVALIGLAGDAVDWPPDLLESDNADTILALNNVGGVSLGGASATDMPGAWRAAATLGIWTALFLMVALVIFHRRDVTSG